MVMKVRSWEILSLILIAIFALSVTSASAAPTMSSMAGTYVQQSSSGIGYTIILYSNGTGTFSGHVGTWTLMNSTNLEGSYYVLGEPITSDFTITSHGFTSVQTGNEYVKTASASSSPTPAASVPEFSNSTLILVAISMAITLFAVGFTAKKRSEKS